MPIRRLFPARLFSALALVSGLAAAEPPSAHLHWLDGAPPAAEFSGVAWGVPWPRGAVKPDAAFALTDDDGRSISVQNWPLAFWPDGSLKWSAHAVPPGEKFSESLTLSPGQPASPARPVAVAETSDAVRIDTGVLRVELPKTGRVLIREILRSGRPAAGNLGLVLRQKDAPEPAEDGSVRQQSLSGEITSVTVEQRGPVRAVVRIEGRHAGADGRAWLPFVLRLYAYAGSDSLRLVHTIVYDGDATKDFISGLGLRFEVPLVGPLHDRHVRFAGEDRGVWAEAVRGVTGLRRDPGEAARRAQIVGQATPPLGSWNPRVAGSLDLIPAFGDFTLVQPAADAFEIRKRTRGDFPWLVSAAGRRSPGFGYVGTPAGGATFGIRNFWQSYPAQIDIRGATGDRAAVTLWLWSPEARPMDLRFYHDGLGQDTFVKQREGLDLTYEDYEPGFGTPTGVARTSELTLRLLPGTPSHEEFARFAALHASPPVLVATPETLKAAGVFGDAIWSLPNRSNPRPAAIEDQLDALFAHYQKEVDQRRWYGFWNYGDVMHTYDADRHVWRYDVGGYAWDNSELSPDLWLWYAFLRTGRADIFRMAEAMTRHTGEVDVYHLGRFAGLGSRHNVLHWGDSAKQLRISTAANRRFFYYLTADERTGDLLRELLDADRKVGEIPPGRKLPGAPAAPPADAPMRMNVGTDWSSLAAAWLTEWERTGDPKYRDKILNGMRTIARLPHGWFSGGGGYDPGTGKFLPDGDGLNVSHLSVVFGGFEVNAELLDLLDVPEYEKAWLQYCALYNATADEQRQALGQDLGKRNLRQAHSRLTAYAGWKTGDPRLLRRAWREFLAESAPITAPRRLVGPDVLRPIDEVLLSTNGASQWALAAIQCLALANRELPTP